MGWMDGRDEVGSHEMSIAFHSPVREVRPDGKEKKKEMEKNGKKKIIIITAVNQEMTFLFPIRCIGWKENSETMILFMEKRG